MKKFKMFAIISCLFAVIMLTACSNADTTNLSPQQKLSTPVISWDDTNNRIYWESISNAAKYEIMFCDTNYGDNIMTTYNNYLDLQDGLYEIKIKAISESPNYINSDFSEKKEVNLTTAQHSSYVEKEIIDNMLRIYVFEVSGLPTFEKISIYDGSNLILSLTKDDFSISKADLNVNLNGYKINMSNHDCYFYEIQLETMPGTNLNARFLSDKPYVRDFDFGFITNKGG